VVQLKSIPSYKYPSVDSGVTPIGSAGRTPDRKSISKKNLIKRDDKEGEDLSKEEMKKKKTRAYD
jgi:hypothetical protein